jgi:hypothetical protein
MQGGKHSHAKKGEVVEEEWYYLQEEEVGELC